jgi:hypothetical protein
MFIAHSSSGSAVWQGMLFVRDFAVCQGLLYFRDYWLSGTTVFCQGLLLQGYALQYK